MRAGDWHARATERGPLLMTCAVLGVRQGPTRKDHVAAASWVPGGAAGEHARGRCHLSINCF